MKVWIDSTLRARRPASVRARDGSEMERLLSSILQRALHKTLSRYFEDLDVSALRLSPFAGDVVLTNLLLRMDTLRAIGLPLSFERGFVRELRIRVPWLKLQSEAIEVLVDMVEVVASSSAAADKAADEDGNAATAVDDDDERIQGKGAAEPNSRHRRARHRCWPHALKASHDHLPPPVEWAAAAA